MTMAGRKAHEATSDRSRLMFEHVDRRGRVRLLPLTHETQQLFAVGMLGAQGDAPSQRDNAAQPAKTGTRSFTAREWQVLDLLVSGLSSKLIAHKLEISSRTVEIYRANLMRKMGVRNTASLIRAAFLAA
jgi:DNA-binding NarL/FixJ family response regulator